MKRTVLASALTYLCLFLLPWQTVWIYDSISPSLLTPLQGREGEYWKLTHYVVQFLIVIAVLVRWETQKSEVAKKIMKKIWWFFAAMVFVSFLSVHPYLSGGFLFHLFSAVLLFWLLLDERIETRKIIWFFSLGLIAPCLLGWWQVLTGSSLASTFLGLAGHLAATPGTSVVEVAGERLMRAYGSFPHPNIFGGYLAMAITFILVSKNKLLYHTTSTLKHSITLIILTLLTSTLVITFSRSAWLALTIGIFSFFIVSAIERKKISRKFLSGLAIVIVAFVATAALFNNAIFTRLDATDRLETKSLTERQSEYQMIGEVIKTNPFVGVGPGAYTIALAEKFPGHDVWFYQPMHNLFLLFFAETGLLGLMFFGFVVWAVVRRRDGRQFVTAIIPIVTTITTLAIFDHYLWSHWSGLVLLVVVLAIFVKVR
ncbi:TPA: hypothetical protein DEA21_04165 [Candidatus Uhrbacteria bacterium]|nr:hypothetical protein [Candidatus Uhrbacteria bacterium]HCU31377.1 hypothetical protein [Candidatus Uhrbacteria bacterium]